MRSMQLLIYRADEQLLEVRARDFKTHWMTAVEALDDDTYLGAENSYNLFTLRKNSDAASDEDRNRLEACPLPWNSDILAVCTPSDPCWLLLSTQGGRPMRRLAESVDTWGPYGRLCYPL